MSKDEAMKLALEALEMWCPMTATYLNTRDEAITALREARAQQPAQQEPVAKDNSNYRFDPPGLDPSHQKPVAWWIPKAKQFCLPSSDGTRPFAKAWEPLYTSPPAQRTWVGLTGEERSAIESEVLMRGDNYPEVLAAIEAKLKEKNT